MTAMEGAREAASGERQGGRPVTGMLLGDSFVLSINIYRTSHFVPGTLLGPVDSRRASY